MIIKLRKHEYDLLINLKLTDRIQSLIKNAQKKGEAIYYLEIEDEIADEIREQLVSKFQLEGIDYNGEPTKQGIVIEDLIDKFFTG